MKRTVFLLGAGAAIDWNGPSNPKLTELLSSNGPKNRSGQYITKYILDHFEKETTQKINFEGLIDIIEQCIQFWSCKDTTPTIGNLLINKKDDFWNNTINYEYVGNGVQTTLNNSIRQATLTPEEKFFIYLLTSIYAGINSEISKYGSGTVNTDKIGCDENKIINKLAQTYFTNFSKNNYLRIYTLNYDRVIQYLFHKGGLTAFQGFNSEDLLPKVYGNEYQVDSKRILTSFNENCIYHLHGNYAWHIKRHELPGIPDEIVNGYFGRIGGNRTFSFVEAEKYKLLVQSNIITGYSKVQRTNLTPFKQMASAFDIDCHAADEIIIIGYSFGDLHINETIRQAKASNPDCKITCISPDINIGSLLLEHILWNNRSMIDNDFIQQSKTLKKSKHYNCDIYYQSWKDYLEAHKCNQIS
ncbi:SIR2 family protein [Sphingobacterium faecium]|uniref:SIR2 family protein n=1 Tax=Sphingobacterium faecium TaxID=34087 RepID=UPI0024685337|nr:SIR2 family protein [Sphingobacterium faecium]MDH5827321.1 SIR2 family protein [Sphingobacterium faecium]